ncbi:MAG: OmpH family outer membrane protein [Bacteroidaceae bacterium]|jgi:outer membrane protein|nr:OmpH family outer membrane protein [Bacteroidaceae bacterium]
MKKFLILILMLAPMSMLAQKFGYVNSAEIIQVMPEYNKALKDLQALEKMYTDEFNSMRTELEKKGTEFEKLQQDAVPENILKRRYDELMQMQQRLQEYGQEVQNNLAKAESEKMMEIQTVLKKALDSVGNEGSYVCIFDVAGGIPFINTTICDDVTQKVRTKLGIPANAVPASVKK